MHEVAFERVEDMVILELTVGCRAFVHEGGKMR